METSVERPRRVGKAGRGVDLGCNFLLPLRGGMPQGGVCPSALFSELQAEKLPRRSAGDTLCAVHARALRLPAKINKLN